MKALVLIGPTGIGKSDLAVEIAASVFPETFEIISCDSVQVYRYLDIGTGKLSENEMRGVPHHLINVVPPDYHFEVNEFITRAYACSEGIFDRKKIPFFVGGTGMYISSFFNGLSSIPLVSDEIRNSIIDEMTATSPAEMHVKLAQADPESAGRINPNDRQRIVRALEVYRGTGLPISHFRDQKSGYRTADTCFIGIESPREYIYDRINNRVDKMLESGLIKEVENILEMGYSQDLKSLNSIGYFEIIQYLNGKIALDEAVYLIKRNSRKYAKKQLTWFKRSEYINWFDASDHGGIYKKIKNFLGC